MLSDIRKLRCVTNCNRLIETVQCGFSCPPSSLALPLFLQVDTDTALWVFSKRPEHSRKNMKNSKILCIFARIENPLLLSFTRCVASSDNWSKTRYFSEENFMISMESRVINNRGVKLILSIKWCYSHTKLQFA